MSSPRSPAKSPASPSLLVQLSGVDEDFVLDATGGAEKGESRSPRGAAHDHSELRLHHQSYAAASSRAPLLLVGRSRRAPADSGHQLPVALLALLTREHCRRAPQDKQALLLILEFMPDGSSQFREMRRAELLAACRSESAAAGAAAAPATAAGGSRSGKPRDIAATIQSRDMRALDPTLAMHVEPSIMVRRHAIGINLLRIKGASVRGSAHIHRPSPTE